MKIRNKHIIYLGMVIVANTFFLLLVVFNKELTEDIGASGLISFGFFVQVISTIITVLGVSFMQKSFRKSSSFYFWLFATIFAFIPVIYYMFV